MHFPPLRPTSPEYPILDPTDRQTIRQVPVALAQTQVRKYGNTDAEFGYPPTLYRACVEPLQDMTYNNMVQRYDTSSDFQTNVIMSFNLLIYVAEKDRIIDEDTHHG